MSLGRDEILAPRPLAREEVLVPEWGSTVYVRVMSGFERDAYEADLLSNKDKRLENMRARLLVRCACDANGNLLFTPEDADALGAQNWQALDRLAAAAQKLNRLSDAAIEEIKGNSLPTLGAAQS